MDIGHLSHSFSQIQSLSSNGALRSPVGEENQELLETPFSPVQQLSSSVASNATLTYDRAQINLEIESESPEQGREPSQFRGNSEVSAEERVEAEQLRSDRALIQELAARDREVRAHEQAHAAVGGLLTGAPTYQYTRGPDGVNYAVSGEVSINLSSDPDPEVTLEIARQARRAALAPAEPSAQDRAVAAQATQLELSALTEIRAQRVEEARLEEAELNEDSDDLEVDSEDDSEEVSLPFPPDPSDNSEGSGTGVTSTQPAFDLTRRLIESGALLSSSPSGGVLDQSV